MDEIQWQDFSKVQLCVGTVIAAEIFPEARKPAYKLTIDFGEHGVKKSSAQITELYSPEALIGKQIVAVINFPEKQIGPFMSQCLVTGFYNEAGQVCLAVPDGSVANGARLA